MQLVILRHAHAKNHGPSGDHSRPLSEHGHAQAHETASFLRAHNVAPEYAVVSDAVRTTQTFADLKLDAPVEYSKRAYNADAETLAQLVSEAPDDITSVMLVAHNPGITDLAHSCGYDGIMSTGSAVIVEWDGTITDFVTADRRVVESFVPN